MSIEENTFFTLKTVSNVRLLSFIYDGYCGYVGTRVASTTQSCTCMPRWMNSCRIAFHLSETIHQRRPLFHPTPRLGSPLFAVLESLLKTPGATHPDAIPQWPGNRSVEERFHVLCFGKVAVGKAHGFQPGDIHLFIFTSNWRRTIEQAGDSLTTTAHRTEASK